MTIYCSQSRGLALALILLVATALSGCSDSTDSSSFHSKPETFSQDILAKEGLPELPDESDFQQPASEVRAQASTVQFGDTILVSSGASGQAANGYSYQASLSENGTYAVFTSRATNLDGSPSGTYYQVYRKNLETGAVELVSRHNGQNGNPGYYPCYRAKVNKAGDQVAFTSYENFSGSGVGYQVYLRDLDTHTNQLISHTPTGAIGNSSSIINSFQGGGAISFYSLATNLTATDSNGRYDVFAWDPSTDSLEMMSVASDESQAVDHSLESSVSMSGGVGIFRCYDNALEGSGHPDPTLYLRDLDAGLTLPLPGQAGPAYHVAASTGGYWMTYSARAYINGTYKWALYRQYGTSNPVLVHDNVYPYDTSSTEAHGKFIAYVSADQGGTDNDGQYDIYVYDRVNDRHRLVSGNSPGSGPCYRPFISQDGSTICWDQNGQVYAAPNPYWGYQPNGAPQVVSRGNWDAPANGDSENPSLSYTGQYLAFDSFASDLIYNVGNGYLRQVYHHDLAGLSYDYDWASEPLGSYVDEAKRPLLSRAGDHLFFSANSDLQAPYSALFALFRELGSSQVDQVGGTSTNPDRHVWSLGGEQYCCFDTSDNLAAGDTSGSDVYLEDTSSGQLSWVSVDSSGQRVTGSNYGGWVSHDGNRVAWVNYNGSVNNLWVRDLSTGTSSVVATQLDNSLSELANGEAAIDLSGNGRYLAYSKGNDLHRYDLSTSTDVTLTSTYPSRDSLGVSDDGRYLAYFEQGTEPSGVVTVYDTVSSTLHAVSDQSSGSFGYSPALCISGNGSTVSWHAYTDEDNGAHIQIWVAANPAY